jgi:RimJ/RimL family protein N-acetyltransferase
MGRRAPDGIVRPMTTLVKPVLATARLLLRPVTPDDAADLCALDADLEVRRYVDQPDPPTLDDVRRSMIPRWQAVNAATPAVGYWVAEEVGGDRFAGWFHLRPPRAGDLHADSLRPNDLELGYRLRRACWGRGLATEGGRMLIEYGFGKLAAPRVVATALAANAASIRVMEKLGMTLAERWSYKGTIPAVAYALTADERRRAR